MRLSTIFITSLILGFLPGYSFSCPENEIESDCINPCNTCEQKTQCNPSPECEHGCECKPGFLRDENGYCVPEQQCLAKSEEKRCPENALYQLCVPSVIPTCENPHPETDDDGHCVPGCVCRSGFLRRKDGRCVTPQRCYAREEPVKPDPPPDCPKNAIFIKCGSPCPPTCDDVNPEPCEEKCVRACYCKPGYLKRKDGVCVRPMDCQPRKKPEQKTPKCPENAVFIECGSPCPPTCENRQPEPCEDNCTTACFCKPGYLLKSDEGKCVKPQHCNRTHIPAVKCGENQVYTKCGSACAPDCANLGKSIMCTMQCIPGCFCIAGLVKNDQGRCVKPEECPKTPPPPSCAADEQFYNCTPSCDNTCKRYLNPGIRCRCGPPGCFCKEGLVKRSDGKCVPPNQCKTPHTHQCGPNQKYYDCTPSCKNTCEHFFNPAIRCGCGPPGCFCTDGFVKSSDGKCIQPSQCKRCRIPGEVFKDCGTSCPDTCENRGQHPDSGCPYPCKTGCFCKKGLFRNKYGFCVPLEDCPKKHFIATTPSAPKKEKRDVRAVTPTGDDSHGCPDKAECEVYCQCLGDFKGSCVGKGQRKCRCS